MLPCSKVVSFTKLVVKLGVMSHFEIRTSNGNSKDLYLYRFEVYDLLSELADLGFVKETLIFQTWNFKLLIGQKYMPLQGNFSM